MINLLNTSIELGLLYAPAVIGVFLTFRILNFPDLTVDSSFVTGAAVTSLAIKHGVSGLPALIAGFLAGLLAGSLTAFLHTKLKIGKILSGILSFSMLYTINLRLMQGPNVSLLNMSGAISYFEAPMNHTMIIIFLFTTVLLVKIFIDWFLQTEFGLLLRATGDNESTAKSLSINTDATKFIAISISNGLVGFSGGLIAQYQGFADISIGTGTVVLILASLMLGESLMLNKKISLTTLAIVLGSLLYQLIINIALRFGLAGSDLKFITAVIVVLSLLVGKNKKLPYGKQFFNN